MPFSVSIRVTVICAPACVTEKMSGYKLGPNQVRLSTLTGHETAGVAIVTTFGGQKADPHRLLLPTSAVMHVQGL